MQQQAGSSAWTMRCTWIGGPHANTGCAVHCMHVPACLVCVQVCAACCFPDAVLQPSWQPLCMPQAPGGHAAHCAPGGRHATPSVLLPGRAGHVAGGGQGGCHVGSQWWMRRVCVCVCVHHRVSFCLASPQDQLVSISGRVSHTAMHSSKPLMSFNKYGAWDGFATGMCHTINVASSAMGILASGTHPVLT